MASPGIYLFNPDNDLALANFGINYTPPASAAKIAADLAFLPAWYAPEGARVVAEGIDHKWFLDEMDSMLPLHISLIPFSHIPYVQGEKIIPWGWNPALQRRLLDTGVFPENVPQRKALTLLRDYSGRRYAVKMLRELKQKSRLFCGESHFFSTRDEALSFLSARQGDSVLKMPYSGSGKGLIWIKGGITDKQADWCERVIHTQGGVVAEPVFDKVQDFAMEFEKENGTVVFSGYSLFSSASSGAYAGNRLMGDTAIEQVLSGYIDPFALQRLKKELIRKLAGYFPSYNGFLGVDMMICQTPNGYSVHPCVEINMRMNMGIVAHRFHERFVHKEIAGDFRIKYFKKDGEALSFCRKMKRQHPLAIDDERITSGFLALNPVNASTRYIAFVQIGH